MREIIAGANEAGQRLDKLLHKFLPLAGNGFIYKMIRKKNITLNDRRCEGNEILRNGDSVRLWLAEDTIAKFRGEGTDGSGGFVSQDPAEKNTIQTDAAQKNSIQKNAIQMNAVRGDVIPVLTVVYEDENILIFNKPAGLLSQKAKPEDISVNDVLLRRIPPTETFTPSICNRLDRNTSGLIICGKTLRGLQDTAQMLRDRTAHKDYLAVVAGRFAEGREIRTWMEGKELFSEVRPIAVCGSRSYIMVRLHTGKTHQIRRHLSSIGFPILGDRKYGNSSSARGAGRQLLHAYRITLPDGRVIEAPVPEDFQWEHGKPEAFEDLPLRI